MIGHAGSQIWKEAQKSTSPVVFDLGCILESRGEHVKKNNLFLDIIKSE